MTKRTYEAPILTKRQKLEHIAAEICTVSVPCG